MELLNRKKTGKVERPVKVLQFGEGNFLRAFVDYMIDIANEQGKFNGDIVLVKPIEFGSLDRFHDQECQYTVQLRGIVDGEPKRINRIVTSVADAVDAYGEYQKYADYAKLDSLRYIVSNTTEAGIVYDASCKFEDTPPASYPAKLTQFLYRRFKNFGAEEGKGFVILSCELIDNNGKELEKCVLKYIEQWNLEPEFKAWVEKENIFCSTLVDRIVTGYPRSEADEINKENNYVDNIIDTGEIFGFWVIEGPEFLKTELPFDKANLPVLITDDHKPYKQRKVRILNGAHTSMVLGAYLAGQDIGAGFIPDTLNTAIYDEIIPTLTLPKDELMDFAHSVTERFKNPFIDHALLSISLNSTSKWKARVMPSLLGYVEKNVTLPACIAASFAFYIAFYNGNKLTDAGLIAERNGNEYTVMDDRAVLEFFYNHRNDSNSELVHAVMTNTDFWGRDLTEIKGFEKAVCEYLEDTKTNGAYEVMKKLI